MQTPPKKDPKLGVWTPAYASWAIETKSDDDFQSEFKCSKRDAAKHCGVDPADIKPVKVTKESNVSGFSKDKVNDLIDENAKLKEDLKTAKQTIKDQNEELVMLRKGSIGSDKPTLLPDADKAEPISEPVADTPKPAAKKAAAKKAAKKKGDK